MRSTLVDSNVLIELFDEDSEWREWSDAMLTRAAARGPLVINPIVFAEVAAGFDSLKDVDAAVPELYLRREPLPWEAAFLAGRAFVQYPTARRHRVGATARLLHRRPRRCRRPYPADPRRPALPALLPQAASDRAVSRPLAALGIVSVLTVVAPAGHGQSPAAPPNIIVIFADDLGYGDLGAFGAPTIARRASTRWPPKARNGRPSMSSRSARRAGRRC